MFAKAAITGTLQAGTTTFDAEYLVVAGGGGGGAGPASSSAAGGGAGGYRSSVTGEASGGGASAESPLGISLGTPYTVTVGAGGSSDSNGVDSVFGTIVSTGGGGGSGSGAGSAGGSGGGGHNTSSGGTGTASQGFDGGAGTGSFAPGGGGGAGEAGNTDGQTYGGDGVQSIVTGVATYRAGGGGGADGSGVVNLNNGGLGGGGAGNGDVGSGEDGSPNTGGGGGGTRTFPTPGGSGGSGVIIIRVPSTVVAEFSAGVVYNYIPTDDFNVYEITAAGVSDTVTFSQGAVTTVGESLRFNDDDSAYLSRTPASAGDRKTWTWSGWVKRADLAAGGNIVLFGTSPGGTAGESIGFYLNQLNFVHYNGASFLISFNSSQLFRDASAWYHIVVAVDTTQVVQTNRVSMYVNGKKITSFAGSVYPSQNFDTYTNTAGVLHTIGTRSTLYFDGYLSDVYFIDGEALDPSRFGKQDADGIWQPITYTGSYGTNGFHLDFADNSTAAALGTDTSGNGNDWTPSGITTDDQVTDTPSVNYATWNPLAKDISLTLANGNLDASASAAGAGGLISTIAVSSGKWYWEVQPTAGGAALSVGIADLPLASYVENVAGTYLYLAGGSKRISPSTTTAYGASFTDGDIIGVALDMDAGEVTFYKNNVSQGVAFTGLEGTFAAWIQDGSNSTALVSTTNFGQRPFAYTPPTGFQALNSSNLPAPTITDGKAHFQPVLYTGNGTSQTVRGLEFQPDFVWLKDRSTARSHVLSDAVRGANAQLYSDQTLAETTQTTQITSFLPNGFSVGSGSNSNNNGDNFVAWNWNAGGSTVTNTDGSITSQVRANTTAGFSIVSYTGNGSAGATVGHGLSQVPDMIIVKNRDTVVGWGGYHISLGATKGIFLDQSGAAFASSDYWNNTEPTSSVVTLGTHSRQNANTDNYIAYCFAGVDGFSKFGSYTGNGSADGPFVYTGFRPAFVMVKRTDSTGGWIMLDNKRDIDNPEEHYLIANLSNAETTDINLKLDALSNGFKLRANSSATNASGGTHIYMAFAENPFKTSRAR